MQPLLRCRCSLCHLQPLLHLIVVFRSLSCEPTSTDAAAAPAVADAAATCHRLSANPTAAADANVCRYRRGYYGCSCRCQCRHNCAAVATAYAAVLPLPTLLC